MTQRSRRIFSARDTPVLCFNTANWLLQFIERTLMPGARDRSRLFGVSCLFMGERQKLPDHVVLELFVGFKFLHRPEHFDFDV